jgi:nucleoside-diphosphate-sugar epimerase
MRHAEFNILVSGAARGIGYAVYRALGGVGFVRGMSPDDHRIRSKQPFDAIVHCAFNAAKNITLRSAFDYLDDNFRLTERLLAIPHRKFIYISSLDVYPRLGRPIGETEDVDVTQLSGAYCFTKLFSDVLVQRRAENYLILRPATLMGAVMRPNTTLRLLTERNCQLFLAPASRFNYVLHEDIVTLIRIALERDIKGIYNVASADSVSLSEIAAQLALAPNFGSVLYDIGPVDNQNATRLLPAFGRPSWQTLNHFIDSLGPAYVGKGRLSGSIL